MIEWFLRKVSEAHRRAVAEARAKAYADAAEKSFGVARRFHADGAYGPADMFRRFGEQISKLSHGAK